MLNLKNGFDGVGLKFKVWEVWMDVVRIRCLKIFGSEISGICYGLLFCWLKLMMFICLI